VFVPIEKYETKQGKPKERVFPGYERYVFVEMILNDETYNGVKIGGVRHILGSPEPQPVPDEEIEFLVQYSDLISE
jgi:transcription antitermination factor NusG